MDASDRPPLVTDLMLNILRYNAETLVPRPNQHFLLHRIKDEVHTTRQRDCLLRYICSSYTSFVYYLSNTRQLDWCLDDRVNTLADLPRLLQHTPPTLTVDQVLVGYENEFYRKCRKRLDTKGDWPAAGCLSVLNPISYAAVDVMATNREQHRRVLQQQHILSASKVDSLEALRCLMDMSSKSLLLSEHVRRCLRVTSMAGPTASSSFISTRSSSFKNALEEFESSSSSSPSSSLSSAGSAASWDTALVDWEDGMDVEESKKATVNWINGATVVGTPAKELKEPSANEAWETEDADCCAICLEPMDLQRPLELFEWNACHHCYHSTCIQEFGNSLRNEARTKALCPLCRSPGQSSFA